MNQDRLVARAFWDVVRRIREASTRRRDASASHSAAAPPTSELARAIERLDAIRDDCRKLVTRRASLSAGVAVVPVPGLDFGTDIAILLKLLPQINERFGLTPSQIDGLDEDTKRTVMLFIGSVGSALVGRLITRELVVKVLMRLGVRVTTKGVVKFVPLLGQALSASISFGAMKMLGNRHIDDCYQVARQALLQQSGASVANGSGPGGAWEVVD